MRERVQEVIDLLELQPHPEGGWFKETYRSELVVQSPVVQQPRRAITDIYFLLEQDQVSRFHRVMHDEIWHFYEGSAVQLYHYDPRSKKLYRPIIGAIVKNVQQKYVIPAGHWQAACPTGEYSLCGCCVAPGFDFADFIFLDDFPQIKNELLNIDSSLIKFA